MRIKHFKVYIALPIIIILAAAVIGFAVGGFNLGIDFTGGTLLMVEMGGEFDVSDVGEVLESLGISEYTIAQTGDMTSKTKAAIRVKDLGSVEAEDAFRLGLAEGLESKYPQSVVESTERVGAVAGETMVQNAFWSVIIASLLMLVYIWLRFEVVSGVIAIATSVLNVLIVLASMIFCRSFLQLNSSFIAACLTVVGYSINNTIIVLDRIREENKRMGKSVYTRGQVAEYSVKMCMGRMINTTITSLATITCLYVLGVDSIKEFALPLIIGIASGTFVSIFIAPAMWGIWMDKYGMPSLKGKKKGEKSRKRAGARA